MTGAGWYTVVLFCVVWNVFFNCIVQDSLHHNMVIGTMWPCVYISCTPSQSIWLLFGYALFWCYISGQWAIYLLFIYVYSILCQWLFMIAREGCSVLVLLDDNDAVDANGVRCQLSPSDRGVSLWKHKALCCHLHYSSMECEMHYCLYVRWFVAGDAMEWI